MNTTTSAAWDNRAVPPPAGSANADQAKARPCPCDDMIAAFESAPGPRRKRASPEADGKTDAVADADVIECLDAEDPRNAPATMVQRIPV